MSTTVLDKSDRETLNLFASRGLTDNVRRLQLCNRLGSAGERLARAEEGRVDALVCRLEGNGRGDQTAAERKLAAARQELREAEEAACEFIRLRGPDEPDW
jgi:hypothetical protein